MKKIFVLFLLLPFLTNCGTDHRHKSLSLGERPAVIVLGIAQDGGYPQAGMKDSPAWENYSLRRHATCLAVVDPVDSSRWLFDCTPDFKHQLHILDQLFPVPDVPGLSGIFLTHAHIGHYTGLMFLGREAIGARKVPVYAMPAMTRFIETNGPWSLLVRLKNIDLRELRADSTIRLNERIRVTPIRVPHRAEYTETVGFRIDGPSKSVLFIPDIDKWQLLDAQGIRIENLIAQVDFAFLDGTFFRNGEIPGRDMRDIPHPFIEESLQRFAKLPEKERNKIYFIHLNRSNPLVWGETGAISQVQSKGFHVAQETSLVVL